MGEVNESEYMPQVLDLSAVSQLPAALPADLSADSLVYVSVLSGGREYMSMKMSFSDLQAAIADGLSVSNIREKLQLLSGVISSSGHEIRANIDEPYIISSMWEENGVILSVGGYRLSSAVQNTISANLAFDSYVAADATIPIGAIRFGDASCVISAAATQPLVNMKVWPGAWKI